MIDITLPDINGKTEKEQLGQIRSYLYEFAQQLQWALSAVEGGGNRDVVLEKNGAHGAEAKATDPETLAQLKAFIIKSADIVEAHYAAMTKLFEGSDTYKAISDFGTYISETNNVLYGDGTGIVQQISMLQSSVDQLDQTVAEQLVDGYIRKGILGYEDEEQIKPIIGIEVGQTDITVENGEEVKTFHRFARFTADKLSFYNANGDEMAYISQNKLHILDAKISGNLELGEFMFDTTDGLALIPIDINEEE